MAENAVDSYTDENGNEVLTINGQPAGYMMVAEDGANVLVDFDGTTVLGAATPDGQELNPAEYQFADDSTDLDALRAEVDQLQQRVDQPPPRTEQQRPGPTEQDISDMIDAQFGLLEKDLGRSFSRAEADQILGEMLHQADAGQHPDMHTAAARAGIRSYDDMNDKQRVEAMTQKYAEATQDNEPTRERRESYDFDDDEQRVAYLKDRAAGILSDDDANEVKVSNLYPDAGESPEGQAA